MVLNTCLVNKPATSTINCIFFLPKLKTSHLRNDDGNGMFRTAANRFLSGARHCNGNIGLRFRRPLALITSSRFSTTENQPFSNPHSIHDAIPVSTTENPSFYDSTSSTSSSSSDEDSRRESSKSRAKYEDEHARLLHASLTHVVSASILFLLFFSI